MNTIALGTIAGAAGTIALDLTSYADMAIRGRPASAMPAEVIRRMTGIENENRRRALGTMLGHANGIIAGVVCGGFCGLLRKVPSPVVALMMGAAAMAASDIPAIALGATNPKEWGVEGWLADIVPHIAYGVAAACVFSALASDAAATNTDSAQRAETGDYENEPEEQGISAL
jgi:hypothetical protein